ncbi:hypothetical protein [Micromonospora craniellae]|uniref:Uncharacterized protein n=1 Tax=Micromonospora craniellae TaxID=2294034 RepID=A0A372G591_9ACTN|nr:hypothetical protein [Micromonospora craniellae]QOC90423.1 hypothetical protein ID554_19845 [Micromonospora craniellae]RFS48185.1 hypothetical protein D0Q02_01495 [Micromonospora craniellae]
MSAIAAAWFVLLTTAALVPVGVLLQYANWQHSRYRNRLWNLRDSLVDDLLSGDIEFSNGALVLLDVIETHIRNTRRHTFTDVGIAYRLLRGTEITPITGQLEAEDVRPADRDLLLSYFTEFRQVTFSYLKRSSLSGWLVSLGLRLSREPAPGRVASPRPISPELRQQVEQVELRGIPKLTPPAHAIRRGPILDNPLTVS